MKVRQNMRLLISARPYYDESFTGYVLRLTELNGYDSLSWVYEAASLNYKGTHQGSTYVFAPPQKNLILLALLAGINSTELLELTYLRAHSSADERHVYFFGQIIPQYLLQITKPKICPDCLSDVPYCRRIWELSAITACPIHTRLLINECPNCNRRISWSRTRVRVCICKFDWRDSPLAPVSEHELRLTHQIYRLCSLPVKANDLQNPSKPISRLSLNDLLLVLFFIAGQFRGISSTTSKRLVSDDRNKSFHNILTDAYFIFENWPSNYFQFLDQRRTQERSAKRTYQRVKSILYIEFGSFYSGLCGVLSGNQFNFMRGAFIEYIVQNIMRGYSPASTRYKIAEESLNREYILKSDVRRLLGVDNLWINQRIRTGALKTVVRSKGKKRLVFIKAEDVTRLTDEH